MDKDYGLENRKYVIGGVAVFIVVVYIIRLFTLPSKKSSIRHAASYPTGTAACSSTTKTLTT